jgi:hypothetical protein
MVHGSVWAFPTRHFQLLTIALFAKQIIVYLRVSEFSGLFANFLEYEMEDVLHRFLLGLSCAEKSPWMGGTILLFLQVLFHILSVLLR